MITLNGTWQMNCKGEDSWQEGQVPGTVYTDLLRNGQMKDPYVGRNLLRQLLRSAAGREPRDYCGRSTVSGAH